LRSRLRQPVRLQVLSQQLQTQASLDTVTSLLGRWALHSRGLPSLPKPLQLLSPKAR
jgi:hypothetical protein